MTPSGLKTVSEYESYVDHLRHERRIEYRRGLADGRANGLREAANRVSQLAEDHKGARREVLEFAAWILDQTAERERHD